jgi:hypothetical protein
MGPFYQVIVARHRATGEVAGFTCRATRPLFVNGQVEEVGYLSQLRVAKQFQGQGLVSLGFRYLRQLHADKRVTGYLATIIEGNKVAAAILVDRTRQGYPVFREVCRLWTLALIVRRAKPIPPSPYQICRGSKADLSDIVALFRRRGPARQFFPAYTEADFTDSPLTLGFRPEDFILARQNGELVGVLGLWEQSGYKQSVVQGYGGMLGRFRPLYNLGLRLIGARPLTSPGEHIHFAYASFICTANNNPAIFDLLLGQAYNLAVKRGYAYLMVGLAEGDPLLAVARRYLHIPYPSRLYTICWDDASYWHERLDGRIPYIEIAAL